MRWNSYSLLPVVPAAHIHMPPNSVRSQLYCFLTLKLIHVTKQKCLVGISAGWAETVVICNMHLQRDAPLQYLPLLWLETMLCECWQSEEGRQNLFIYLFIISTIHTFAEVELDETDCSEEQLTDDQDVIEELWWRLLSSKAVFSRRVKLLLISKLLG